MSASPHNPPTGATRPRWSSRVHFFFSWPSEYLFGISVWNFEVFQTASWLTRLWPASSSHTRPSVLFLPSALTHSRRRFATSSTMENSSLKKSDTVNDTTMTYRYVVDPATLATLSRPKLNGKFKYECPWDTWYPMLLLIQFLFILTFVILLSPLLSHALLKTQSLD